jgi:Rrf2 family protein
MKITSQEEYGLRCLLRLARVPAGQSLTIPEIAAAESLSAPYVAKLLSVMRQGGLIESVRGRTGGYRLGRGTAQITLGAVMRVLGEPLFDEPGFCQRHPGTETTTGACVHLGDCTLRALWHTLEHWMRRAMDRITLADLLQGEGQLMELLRTRLAEAVQEPPASLIPLPSLLRVGAGAARVPELASGMDETK